MRSAAAKRCLVVIALLVFAVISAMPAQAAGTHRYSGRTAQKFHLWIATEKGRVSLIRLKIRLRCRDGSVLFDDLSDFEPATLQPNGRFSDLQAGATDEVIWRGRLAGAKVSGSLRVRDKLKSGVPCDSGSVGFAARQARRQVVLDETAGRRPRGRTDPFASIGSPEKGGGPILSHMLEGTLEVQGR